MQINYFYKKNATIEKYLQDWEIAKRLIDLLPQLPHIEENIRRKSLLKSSLYSARIEGNRLRIEDISERAPSYGNRGKEKLEVFNILSALRWIYSSRPQKLNKDTILTLHQMVLKDLSPDAGHFRSEPSAIFNQAGVAIYMPPPPQEIPILIEQLTTNIDSSHDAGTINAALSHFAFEKIHPFLDGNGRVGRLLSTLILKDSADHLRGLISLEEFFENQRQTYYGLLSIQGLNITPFVEFFLEGLVSQANLLLETIKNTKEAAPEDSLLPRRREILEIIRDHQLVSFDFIRRRFAAVAPSTLHYDLGRLKQAGFIKKLGSTNGVVYTPADTSTRFAIIEK